MFYVHVQGAEKVCSVSTKHKGLRQTNTNMIFFYHIGDIGTPL